MTTKTRKSGVSRQPAVSLLRHIRLFATDVDGVLTDAGMYYSESGDEWKKFNTRDGMGIKLLQRAGLITAIVTQERTRLVARRAEKLAIPELHQGVMDKLSVIRDIAARHGISLDQVAYIGDDVNDIEALKAVGLSASPADGLPEVVRVVKYLCQKKGGEGAVRELAEMILKAQGQVSSFKGQVSSSGNDRRS
ncbi:MAG: HAD hydrolase family protein [Nitrospira sp.]|nr:HAD hydrolase family protein [Nitrospira sp.]